MAQALVACRHGLLLLPKNPLLLKLRADALLALGENQQAVQAYQEAIRLDWADESLHSGMVVALKLLDAQREEEEVLTQIRSSEVTPLTSLRPPTPPVLPDAAAATERLAVASPARSADDTQQASETAAGERSYRVAAIPPPCLRSFVRPRPLLSQSLPPPTYTYLHLHLPPLILSHALLSATSYRRLPTSTPSYTYAYLHLPPPSFAYLHFTAEAHLPDHTSQ